MTLRAAALVASLVALLPAAVAGCGGGESGPSPSEITGSWRATRIEYASTTGLGTVELVAGGGSGSLVLRSDGSGALTIAPAARAPLVVEAPWSLDGAHLTLGTPSNNMNWSTELQGNALRLRGANAGYDLDGDGTGDPCTLNLDLVR